jgi:hypothetical protein
VEKNRTLDVAAGPLALRVLLAAAMVFPPGLALAQSASRTREQRESDARRACAAGHVDEGIEILADLYASYSHPNYIYNQGRCYQENGKNEQAVARFREYLRVGTDAPPAARERAERFIRELEGEPKGTPAPAPPPPPREPEPRPLPPPPPVTTTAAPTVTQSLPPAPPPYQPSPALQAGAIAFGIVGGLGLVGALIAGAKVRSLETDVESAPLGRFDVDQLADHERKAQQFETLQWVGYGVAAVGLLGAVICIIANKPSTTTRASRFTIAGLPGGQPGLGVAGRF